MNINKHIYYLEQLTGKQVILVERETFFVPQDLEGRQEKYLQSVYRMLNQEVVDGDLELEDLSIKNLGRVKRVNGDVDIWKCYNLENLGYLEYVKEDFWCNNNRLISLKGSPKKIEGNFGCIENFLTTLEGGPRLVKGDFNCSNNKLVSLKGAPRIVGGDFICSGNNLTSLKGAPKEVNGSFLCGENFRTFTKKRNQSYM